MTGTNKSQQAKAAENAIFSELSRVQDLLQPSPGAHRDSEDIGKGAEASESNFAEKPLQESAFTQHVLLELEALQQSLNNYHQPPLQASSNVKSNSAKNHRRGLKEVQTCMFEEVFGEPPVPVKDPSVSAKPFPSKAAPTPAPQPAEDPSNHAQESLALYTPVADEPASNDVAIATEESAKAPTKAEAASTTPKRTSLFSPLTGDPSSTPAPSGQPPANPAKSKGDTKAPQKPDSGEIDRLVDDLVAQYLPEIEQRLRQSLKRLLDK